MAVQAQSGGVPGTVKGTTTAVWAGMCVSHPAVAQCPQGMVIVALNAWLALLLLSARKTTSKQVLAATW